MAVNGSKKALLVAALARGHTIAEASKQAKIGGRTAYTWLKQDPTIKAEVNELQQQATSEALALLTQLGRQAAITLGRLLDSDRPTVRLGAARAILELGPRLREIGELEERLAALEEAAPGLRRIG